MSIRIPLDQIDVPRRWRKVKKQGVTQLADSLRREGLLHPIGVRLDAASGRYVLVFGRHRLEAARKLAWAEIDATLFDGLDEHAACSLTDAENLFRTELAPAERVLALKKWHESYAAANPDTVGSRAGGLALARSLGRLPADAPPPQKTFVEHVEEVTGQDRKSVERYLYSGKNLTEEQLLSLATNNVAHEHIKAINRLDPGQIAATVALIAAGVGPREAIAEATLPPGATSEVVGDPDAPRAEADLSDEEWVLQECGEVLERLKYTAVFYADAILYRRLRDARAKLRNVAKKPLARARGKAGPFFALVARFCNVDHPKNWSPCGPCGSTGMTDNVSKCGTCKGDGYLITKESR